MQILAFNVKFISGVLNIHTHKYIHSLLLPNIYLQFLARYMNNLFEEWIESRINSIKPYFGTVEDNRLNIAAADT